mmetsp:Transcript_13912/g.30048  ORF Transcript_13912/g.30048 Transcript_13912/m.30048 type:complete len:92 (-) Transcript_13912:1170-1445(-)
MHRYQTAINHISCTTTNTTADSMCMRSSTCKALLRPRCSNQHLCSASEPCLAGGRRLLGPMYPSRQRGGGALHPAARRHSRAGVSDPLCRV